MKINSNQRQQPHGIGSRKSNRVPGRAAAPGKTKEKAIVPVQAKLEAIMAKYKTGIEPISNQKFNKNVKILMKMAGFNQIVSMAQYRGGKMEVLSVEKWRLIGSHTARRSFATNAYLAGIPVIEIMKFTGHRSSAAFMLYIRITAQEAAMNYANHPMVGNVKVLPKVGH